MFKRMLPLESMQFCTQVKLELYNVFLGVLCESFGFRVDVGPAIFYGMTCPPTKIDQTYQP